ncbi:magnesium and cobalt transport protein CorA [Tumebacillus avium]|uniref:Magnesium transport protein CorA n=1 Tax=Tumebacillus avium TaxID=1903704 RepID=A0A1Y0IS27_9BACL|nr:magnesium/cobalt transporter CorA [Tumebacillus avium]ARU63418.1 magnesium and cobalt transport protein CorA [Tumebacillus avium]
MIRILAVTKQHELLQDLALHDLHREDIAWYWVDFSAPNQSEALLLRDHFKFHPLAVEDCFHFLQRPKIDHYDDYHFFVLHALNQMTLDSEEIDLFVGPNFLVSFHLTNLREVETVWARVLTDDKTHQRGPTFISYLIIDTIVDNYFPAVQQLEDQLDVLEDKTRQQSTRTLMDQVFEIRTDLLALRRTIVPTRDLLYRVLNAEQLESLRPQRVFFSDIYDHLLKLSEMIDANRELTADIRDSYMSLSSNRMNSIMMILTAITTIFMPLTLLTGIYGMNFDYMPGLHEPRAFFIMIASMMGIGVGLFMYFRSKGWFD